MRSKKIWVSLALFFASVAYAVDVKISQLPLGTASSIGVNDSFPYVASNLNITRRLTLFDIANLAPIVATYAPKASPTFTGTLTASTISASGTITGTGGLIGNVTGNVTGNLTGNVTGNASTATALASNPTDCSSNEFASAIAANGNLTCSSIPNAATTATSSNTASAIVARDGSGNFVAGTITAALTGNASTSTALAANPSDCASDRYATTIAANGDLTCAQVSLSAGVTSTLPLGNGGTGQTTKAAAFDALSPMTTAGDLIYGGASGTGTRLAAGTSGQYLKSAGAAAPVWTTFQVPTFQGFTSGSGTYTTPAGVNAIHVRMVGGGGSGGGGGTVASIGSNQNGANGGATTFGLASANGGAGGSTATAAGGTVSLSTYPGIGTSGGQGVGWVANNSIGIFLTGGIGGASFFGGGGGGAPNSAGSAAIAYGSGGGGGGTNGTATAAYALSGGGAGGYADFWIVNPAGSYSYAVGAGGVVDATHGAAATSGFAGGNGAGGAIFVEEFYN